MGEGFPLSLPEGVSTFCLPWAEQDTEEHDGDQGWIVEASTGGKSAATWDFGEVGRVVLAALFTCRGFIVC